MKEITRKGKSLLIITLCLTFSWNVQAQKERDPWLTPDKETFDWSWRLDGPLVIGGAGLAALGFYLEYNVDPLNESGVLKIDKNLLPGLDQLALDQTPGLNERTSDILLYSSFVLPFTLLGSKAVRKEFLPVIFMYLETATAVNGITGMTKGLTKRPRPYVYNPDVPLHEKTTVSARHSFFSGHTSNVAAYSFLTAYMIDRYADRKILEVVGWAGAAILPALTGYFRFTAGKHFPTDVIVGYIVGAGTGILIPVLHRAQLPEDISESKKPRPQIGFTGNGISVFYRF